MVADQPAGEAREDGRKEVVRHARYAVFHMAEVAVPKELFEQILRLMGRTATSTGSRVGLTARCIITTGVRLNDEGKSQMDGSGVVLEIRHGGSDGKIVSAAHGFPDPGRMLAFPPFQRASGECQFRSIATRSSRLVAIDRATPVGIGDHPGSVRQAGDGDGSGRFGTLSALAAGRQAAGRGGKRWAFTGFQLDGFATARTRIGRATGRLGRGHRYAKAKRRQRHQKRLHRLFLSFGEVSWNQHIPPRCPTGDQFVASRPKAGQRS